MMKIVVVGSGVSGAHAALTLLERGHDVELWDVGREESPFPEKNATFHDLKSRLADPVTYFLGADLHALIPPGVPELLRHPPSRQFLASPADPLWDFKSDGFFPFASFAKGGLANGWGANALAFDENDLAEWPVSFAEMDAAYKTVCARVPVAGPLEDDLSPHLRGVYPSQAPVQLTAADERLLQAYARRKTALNSLGVRLGRARLAVVTDRARENACSYCDRCLWGCPRGSIYNPRESTLRDCEAHRGFRYLPERFVVSLLCDETRVTGIRYFDTRTSEIREESCDVVFLAAGALQTGAIFLRTLKRARPDMAPQSEGLMDTTFVKIPYLALASIGQPQEAQSFQFNRLIFGMVTETSAWPRYLHGELLNLTSLLYYPMIERLPFDSRLSQKLFYALKSALGAATLFFPDKITPVNRQVLIESADRWGKVDLKYQQSEEKETYIRLMIARTQAALRKLGCLPRGSVRSPAGAAIHYAGTVPMGVGAKRCDANGRSNLLANLYIADGAAFPSLPSKSITLSLAAHASRVALNARL
jgi:choline dehydrogenase-like flavoprotein